jgi:methionyl-tRNA formyltransferase
VRAVFFGTPELALPALAAVAERHQLLAVVCQPDKPQGRSSQLTPPPVKVWALEHNIECAQPGKLNDGAFDQWLREKAPDVCPLVAYGCILKQPVLDVPRYGFINVHPSLLPKYRGPSPIQTAIRNGDSTTGVTIMRLDAGMDTGGILLQRELDITPDDTTLSLSSRLGRVGAELLLEGLEMIESGGAVFTPQDNAAATQTRMYEKEDGRIRWSLPASELNNLIRAAVPWPVAHCLFRGAVCRVHQAEVVDEPSPALPGTVTAVEKERLLVATGKGQLAVRVFQMPGKRAMTMAEFLRGQKIQPGERFEEL